jgi:cysteine desulfurase/selenocysteine lyase
LGQDTGSGAAGSNPGLDPGFAAKSLSHYPEEAVIGLISSQAPPFSQALAPPFSQGIAGLEAIEIGLSAFEKIIGPEPLNAWTEAAFEPFSQGLAALGQPSSIEGYWPLEEKPEDGQGYCPISPEVVSLNEPSKEKARIKAAPKAAGRLGAIQKPRAFVGTVPVEEIRRDFPILEERLQGGRKLVWLDNAATTQKPRAVIDRLVKYYSSENSNVHRGAHELAERATEAYEGARKAAAGFIGAPSPDNIVFVRGATEAINLVAQAYAKPRLGPGDEIALTLLEHHANIVPWQIVAKETGAKIVAAPVFDNGQLDLAGFVKALGPRTKIVAVTHVSNALGTVTPLAEIASIAKSRSIPVVVDGAQSISHLPLSVSALGVDFFAFSGHKIYGPTGIGALYGTKEALEQARPYQGGGNMIADVTLERTLYQEPPKKFEAGTANIAGAVGLGAALDYVSSLGLANIAAYEESLVAYAEALLSEIKGLRLVGTAPVKASVISFVIDGLENEAVARHLSGYGIAVRAGHHCAQPILRRLGLEGTVRPSVCFYNTPGEIELLHAALREIAPS